MKTTKEDIDLAEFVSQIFSSIRSRLLSIYSEIGQSKQGTHKIFSRYEDNLFCYYNYPVEIRRRLRTVNMAEGFFKHLREFLLKYPGRTDENRVNLIMGLFLKGIKVF